MNRIRLFFISSVIILLGEGAFQRSAAAEIKGQIVVRSVPNVQRQPARGGLYAGGGGGSHSHDPMQQLQSPASVVVFIDGYKATRNTSPAEQPVLDQRNLEFVPHILPIVVGTTVRFPNSDDVYHNAFSYSKTKSFDLGRYPKGKSKTITFDQPGIVKVFCEIHAHMSASIIVLENPYFTIPDAEGNYSIKGVPAGTYTLKTWHEVLQPVTQSVTVPGNETITVNLEL